MKQFILYRLHGSDKIPLSPITGQAISVKNSSHWTTREDAIIASLSHVCDGIGLIIANGLWLIDLDHCLISNAWSPLAVELLTQFRGAYVEISTRGGGLHIIGRGDAPAHVCKRNGVEFYTENRFVALTGTQTSGALDFDASHLLPAFVEKYVKPELPLISNATGPVDAWRGPTADDDLISLMLNSKSNPFRRGASFRDLWEAHTDALAAAYPHDTKPYDPSDADAALAQHLAFWTGNDVERIERLMRMSALVREKWQRPDYLPRTIHQACAKQVKFYQSGTQETVTTLTAGSTLLSVEQQIELFQGCTYVMDEHKALIPGGYLIDPARFRVIFGGFTFVMDNENGRLTRNAWEAFTENQGYRREKAISARFRPTLPPGAVFTENGAKFVNMWWPIQVPRRAGDVTPFLGHLTKLIPYVEDRTILISYMAAVVQHPGIKFQWCPVIQGIEGNGKTLFTRCLAFAVGNRYTHLPDAAKVTARFNDWMHGIIFGGVEDFNAVEEVLEALKIVITGERQEVEPKGGKKITLDICCNFLINTNHKDGLRKTHSDRRFAPFYTAQQEKEDLIRDGLTARYFQDLYVWLRNGGHETVAEYLHTYEILDQHNPALGHTAPLTRSTEQAIIESLPLLEQEILEAIAQEFPGFRGGWVSSIALDNLLKQMRLNTKFSHSKRGLILKQLGYRIHPGLAGGRVNNTVLPDGGKPRLFIRAGMPAIELTGAAEISKAYSEAQK